MAKQNSKPKKARFVFKNRIIGHEIRPAGSFLANPENWRIHPLNQQAALSDVLETVGFVQDVIVNVRAHGWPSDQEGVETMVDGHLRVSLALKKGEETEVPVTLVDLTPKEERLVLATLDPIAGLAAVDAAALDSLMKQLDVHGDGVKTMLSKLADDYGLVFEAPKIQPVDVEKLLTKADVLQRKWKVKPGDLWQLGDDPATAHRLICADSADPTQIKRLFASAGAPAALMSTDPPYLVDYKGGTWKDKSTANKQIKTGNLWEDHYIDYSGDDGSEFLESVFKAWQPFLRENAAWFIWHADKTRVEFDRALAACGIMRHQVIIWVKPIIVMGFTKYHMRHEPLWFGWKKGHVPYLHKDFYRSSISASVWYIDLDAPPTSVWEVGWEGGKKRNTEKFHPTQKPIEVFARPMRNHTRLGEICCEPFCGSGSQIMAAEQLGRTVYACEKSPAFCSVTLERYFLATGKTPIKIYPK